MAAIVAHLLWGREGAQWGLGMVPSRPLQKHKWREHAAVERHAQCRGLRTPREYHLLNRGAAKKKAAQRALRSLLPQVSQPATAARATHRAPATRASLPASVPDAATLFVLAAAGSAACGIAAAPAAAARGARDSRTAESPLPVAAASPAVAAGGSARGAAFAVGAGDPLCALGIGGSPNASAVTRRISVSSTAAATKPTCAERACPHPHRCSLPTSA